MFTSTLKRIAFATSLGIALLGGAAVVQLSRQTETQRFIIQGSDVAAVKATVLAVGGEIIY